MNSIKRNIYPMLDWKAFLDEAKSEFQELVEMDYSSSLGPQHFEFCQALGAGAFGKVVLAKYTATNKLYAVKILEKQMVVAKKQVNNIFNEKKILQALNHPFTVYLEYSFKDNIYLFLVLPFVEGGEMFTLLKNLKNFSEDLSRFYSAQVLLALEYLHYCQMIYRDLKPENILLDRRGFVKLTDFGFCKVVIGRTYTLCGTPEYLAPEILLRKGYGKAVDWWAFGVFLFEMTAGYPPFKSGDTVKRFERVVAGRFNIPSTFSSELTDLVLNLLQVDLTRRYGNLRHGVSDIKSHNWFHSIDWTSLFNQDIEPPYVPDMSSLSDLKNFRKFEEFNLLTRDSSVCTKIFDDF